MTVLDRFGRPLPEPPKHRRAVGFHGGTVPLKEDEDVAQGVAPPRSYDPDPLMADHDPPHDGIRYK